MLLDLFFQLTYEDDWEAAEQLARKGSELSAGHHVVGVVFGDVVAAPPQAGGLGASTTTGQKVYTAWARCVFGLTPYARLNALLNANGVL